jgi:hypothetical protein
MAKVTTVELAARLKLFEDKTTIYNQPFSMNAVTYTEHSADRLILATSSGWQAINRGGVTPGAYLEVKSNRPIMVSLDTTDRPWNLGRGTKGGVIALSGSFTHINVKNVSVTNQATVSAVIADENA